MVAVATEEAVTVAGVAVASLAVEGRGTMRWARRMVRVGRRQQRAAVRWRTGIAREPEQEEER